MKKEQLYEALGEIEETYVRDARMDGKKPSPWLKWGTVAASLAAGLLIASVLWSGHVWNGDQPMTEVSDATEETAFGARYVYRIDQGPFSAYVGGKVIGEERIGEKVEDVVISAGWITEEGQAPSDESLSGEVYTIEGVSAEVAAALKFLDKGDAVTTTHYYVILNPCADLSPVEDYVIPVYMPNDVGEE